ncbi:MFS transporter [Planotetraspora kaengkrachanensis]|uniref:MFS transporter n=1 Tax=Planotetraspora kaengkrachanensis TaxID=575193 RepID=A0A8J3LYT2_9ACTN|nr:MFS transporter [Planotetraspora kaengkrachanensis]GIG78928.1 MFS transporter [Planotetraspora kaengkrachanensis]
MGSSSQKAERRPLLLLLAVLCGAPFMAALDVFVVNLAFPAIGRDFAGSSLGDLSWVLNGYSIVYAALLIPLGRWADAVGAKRVFLLGLSLFTLASVIAAVAAGLPMLLAARVAQAVGAAALTPASLGLLVRTAPASRRALAVGLWAASSAIASALGPVIGGLLVELSWRWVFLINAPIGVVLLIVAARTIPAGGHASGGRVNLVAALLAAVGAGALSLALVEGGSWGWGAPPTIVCLLVSVAAAAGLTWDSRRGAAPLIPATVMRVRTFAWANAAMALFSASFAAGLLALVVWLQDVWGYTAVEAGLAIAPGPLMVPLFAVGGQRLLGRVPAAYPAAAGALLWAAGTVAILAGVGSTSGYAAGVLPGWLVAGVGVGLTIPAILTSSTAALPPHSASTGGAVINMSRQIGTVVGVSAFVAILGSGTDAAASPEVFRTAWWIVAAVGLLSAVTALGISTRRAPVQAPAPPLSSTHQERAAR